MIDVSYVGFRGEASLAVIRREDDYQTLVGDVRAARHAKSRGFDTTIHSCDEHAGVAAGVTRRCITQGNGR